MSRLSLKPGGEPGTWKVNYVETVFVDGDHVYRDRYGFIDGIPDADLIAIQRDLAEYFAAKEPVVEKPKRTLRSALFEQRGYVYIAGFIMFGFAIATAGFWFGWNRVPTVTVAPSTGGVIDELCMRPGVECSTSIRYLHPQKSGIVEQEYDTFPTAKAMAETYSGDAYYSISNSAITSSGEPQ